MADVTEVRCWPSCVHALDWSQDNIIALASDERIELLFPNTVSYERDNDVPQWQHVPLQVPWFSNDELPLKDPAPLPNFSIGEEISPSVPIAIAWSPPGLAKHRRCALAVLTSNLVLSLWSVEGKLQEESSWNRRILINHAITDYFLKSTDVQASYITSSAEEQLRLRSRIRAFTWAPSLTSGFSTMGTQASYGPQYLAISNDDNQIVFMVLHSPTSTLGSSKIWNADILTHASLEPKEATSFTDPELFEDFLQQQRFASHISWSPWVTQDGQYRSVVVYATNEDVRARPISHNDGNILLGDEVTYAGMNLRNSGPLSWCPQPDGNGLLTLALFTDSGLVYSTISAEDATIVSTASHDLNGRWDQVSGVVWEYDYHPSPRLHFSSLLSTIQSQTAVLQKAPSGLESGKAPNWKEKIENSTILFSVKNDLKGHSRTKVWGLTASHLGDFIATYNSLHPSDSIEYGPPAGRRGTVALSTLKQYSKIRESIPRRNATAESLLFTLKKLVENTVEDADQMPTFAGEAAAKMSQAYGLVNTADISMETSDAQDLQTLVKELKLHAVFDENIVKDRHSILVSYACNDTSSNELLRTLISYRLATVLQTLPSALSRTPFSAEILMHQKRFAALIDGLLFPDETDDGAIEGDVDDLSDKADPYASSEKDGDTMDIDKATSETERQLDHGLKARSSNATTDLCDFCSAPIPFTDLTTATCTNGHEFPRCGISLLAIQAPGITKHCGICSTPFLSEEFVRAQELDEAEAEPHITLSRVMFRACDVCIYCGGKFVG